jgi:hypothetical protein
MYIAKKQIGSKHLDSNMITLLKQIPSPLSESLNAHYLNASLLVRRKMTTEALDSLILSS